MIEKYTRKYILCLLELGLRLLRVAVGKEKCCWLRYIFSNLLFSAFMSLEFAQSTAVV